MEPEFNQQLIGALSLDHLTEHEQQEVLRDAGVVVMTSALTRAIPLLDTAGAQACDELLAQEAPNTALYEFLYERIPGFQDIVTEEIELLKKTLS